MPLSPGQNVGPYRVVRLLGSGAMGSVYEAMHERIHRRVAMKVLHATLARDSATAARFLNEARAVNIVEHPGLVQISDHGQLEDGTTYIVMEYLAGESLAAYLERKGGKLSERHVLRVGQQIALALAAAHKKGVLHRDLKPHNVMLVKDASIAGGVRVKVVDFGIAKLVEGPTTGPDSVKTQVGELLGTPLYMSPEQCKGAEQVVPASDIYGLGAMMYHMLAGRLPFEATNVAAMLGMHLFEKPKPLKQYAPDASPVLTDLIDRMLSKEPSERPSTETVATTLTTLIDRSPGSGRLTSMIPAVTAVVSVVALFAAVFFFRAELFSKKRASDEPVCSADKLCTVEIPHGIGRLRDILPISDTELFACGDPGVIIRYKDGRWTKMPSGVDRKIASLLGFSATDIWAVGDGGTILHYDGAQWNQLAGVTSTYLTDLWGLGPTDFFIVGKAQENQTTILHYDGVAFTRMKVNASASLNAIAGLDATNIWAVGNQGAVLYFDGTAWDSIKTIPSLEKLNDVSAVSKKDVWVVGHRGTILHFDGESWSNIPSGVRRDLHGVAAGGTQAPKDEVLLVGDHGTVLRKKGDGFEKIRTDLEHDLEQIFVDKQGQIFAVGAPAILLNGPLLPRTDK